MVSLSGPRFRVASEQFYPEDAPVRDVELGPLAIDRHS
jgi:formylglycine-generating enzyme required for sulfatase activity